MKERKKDWTIIGFFTLSPIIGVAGTAAYAWWFGIVAGLGIPAAVGAAFGDPIGGLLWGGFLRIVVIHHTTFFVNSIAHLYGSRPYTEENSARDNALLAFVTNGEGFHNFHHRFP